MSRVAAVEIHTARACPAAHDPRTDAPRAIGVYQFARVYLCEDHREMWDREDARAHRDSGKGACPWEPKTCGRCKGGMRS